MHRSMRRHQISNLVEWTAVETDQPLEPGCTILLGMCSKLPTIIHANLACLQKAQWAELKAVYIIVDCQKQEFDASLEAELIQTFPELNISFFYYTQQQSKQAEQLKLPYLYAWMSWCIGLKHTTTQSVLIHDYDALILSPTRLGQRYRTFQQEEAKIQGIEWYNVNGFHDNDRLACTFECFADTAWLRSFEPVELFNNIGKLDGRVVDYDITLEVQANHLAPEARTISELSQAASEIVHPSQMIHQYTMFRKFPGGDLPCYSMILLPLFSFLAGEQSAFESAKSAVVNGQGNMEWNGVTINLGQLEDHHLHWGLQQSVQALVALNIAPQKDLFDYYQALYDQVGCHLKNIQHDFAQSQHQQWFAQCAMA